MNDIKIIDINPENISEYWVCWYKDVNKHVELRKKIEWFKRYYERWLRMKIIYSDKWGYQWMIEYIPWEYAHRPVDAKWYMFIHCVFVWLKKDYKWKWYGKWLIEQVINEAKEVWMKGVAVVVRKWSFMVSSEVFLGLWFVSVDNSDPDFELMIYKFSEKYENPKFRWDMNDNLKKYKKWLTILRSSQCPYTEKNVNAIIETAKKEFNIEANLVELERSDNVQMCPCAFWVFLF